ncbi:hypothetical protein LTR10_000575 [Elasticomyces elasticus]|nr:hypothetical protein LTR10_000575 [Elasticomyces elasticus]KAK4980177.1 hypothetical protein LTR42_000484 [Elasticomyces elasticus]
MAFHEAKRVPNSRRISSDDAKSYRLAPGCDVDDPEFVPINKDTNLDRYVERSLPCRERNVSYPGAVKYMGFPWDPTSKELRQRALRMSNKSIYDEQPCLTEESRHNDAPRPRNDSLDKVNKKKTWECVKASCAFRAASINFMQRRGLCAAATERTPKSDMALLSVLPPEDDHSCHGFYSETRHSIDAVPFLQVDWACGRNLVEGINKLLEIEIRCDQSATTEVHVPDYEVLLQERHASTADVAQEPLLAKSIRRFRGWLDDCTILHNMCVASDTKARPTRVLDLGSDSDGDVMRLCAHPGEIGPYMALSYCWGGKAVPKTTTSNFEQMIHRIVVADLPQTYKDAIRLAKALDIRFLWIDSLCIVQDDPKDWAREAASMGQVYEGASLVVVAAAAQDVDSGFLQTRTRHLWTDAPTLPPMGGKWSVRERCSHNFTDYAQLPTKRRGWCFQEALVARRCLAFTEAEAVWTCRTECKCECTSSDMNELESELLPISGPDFGDDLSTRHFKNAESAYEYWRKAVVEYSNRSFTHAIDRLPAMTALAGIVGAATGSQYLAGLWRDELLRQLLWVTNRRFNSRTSPFDSYVAPSWSWMSSPAQVWYPLPVAEVDAAEKLAVYDDNMPFRPRTMLEWAARYYAPRPGDVTDYQHSLTTVTNAWCRPSSKTTNPFGTVEDGAIVLNGLRAIAELRLEQNKLKNINAVLKFNGREFSYRVPDMELVAALKLDYPVKSVAMIVHDGRIHTTLQPLHPDDDILLYEDVCGEIVILQIFEDQYLLLCHSQRKPGAFERLGHLGLARSHGDSRDIDVKACQAHLQISSTRSEIMII